MCLASNAGLCLLTKGKSEIKASISSCEFFHALFTCRKQSQLNFGSSTHWIFWIFKNSLSQESCFLPFLGITQINSGQSSYKLYEDEKASRQDAEKSMMKWLFKEEQMHSSNVESREMISLCRARKVIYKWIFMAAVLILLLIFSARVEQLLKKHTKHFVMKSPKQCRKREKTEARLQNLHHCYITSQLGGNKEPSLPGGRKLMIFLQPPNNT